MAVNCFEIEAMLKLVPGVIAMCDSRSARPVTLPDHHTTPRTWTSAVIRRIPQCQHK